MGRKSNATTKADTRAVKRVSEALDGLAMARDYISTVAAGGETPQEQAELAGKSRQLLNDAGKQIEMGLRDLHLLPDGATGWFIDLEREAATQ